MLLKLSSSKKRALFPFAMGRGKGGTAGSERERERRTEGKEARRERAVACQAAFFHSSQTSGFFKPCIM